MLFMIRIHDQNKININLQYSRYRLTDFDINYAFDVHNIGKEFNLDNLQVQAGD